MCLHKLVIRKARRKYCWKVFRLTTRGNLFLDCQGNTNKIVPVGKWVSEMDYRCRESRKRGVIHTDGTSETYPYGFHGFHKKLHAEIWTDDLTKLAVRRVEVRDIVATGIQDIATVVNGGTEFARCSVFTEMKVLPD